MKTLVNKNNPTIRITAPEIKEYIGGYEIAGIAYCAKENWALVEEEYIENRNDGTYTFATTKEEPVDLEKEIRKHTDLFQADIEYPLRLTAIKFYELGRKGGSK